MGGYVGWLLVVGCFGWLVPSCVHLFVRWLVGWMFGWLVCLFVD